MTVYAAATTIDSIKSSLVALRMPRALEVLDATLRRIEQGEIDGIEALDQVLIEERTMRENRRIRTALTLARLTTVKSLAGFDFAFQPSLDKKRILALAQRPPVDLIRQADRVGLLSLKCKFSRIRCDSGRDRPRVRPAPPGSGPPASPPCRLVLRASPTPA
jgi:hypothetical protein